MQDSLLDNLKIARVTNTKEQIKLLDKIKNLENISLLIVDNVANLFAYEYSKKEQFMQKYTEFMKYMYISCINWIRKTNSYCHNKSIIRKTKY